MQADTARPQVDSPAATTLPGGLEITRVPIDSIYEDPANARLHGERNLDSIIASLRRFGQVEPLVVRKGDGRIIGGNGRHVAMKSLGWTECDVVEIELTESSATALGITLNRTAELAEWDDAVLGSLLGSLRADGFDLDVVGFDDDEIAALLDAAGLDLDPGTAAADVIEDEAPDPPAEAFSRRGDLWLLGDHRLLCGDSTSAEDVTRLMAGERAVLFATDPPYLVGYTGCNHPKGKANKDHTATYGATWDEADAEGNEDLWLRFCETARAVAIREDAAWYCWHASVHQAKLQAVWEAVGAFVHQQVIWAKNSGVLTYSWYSWAHEPCFMGWVRPHRPPRNPAKKMLGTVWNLERVRGAETGDHPTPKPVQVFAIPLEQHTRPGELCFEPFSGSGTQIIAAEQLGRRCYAAEIEPRYIDVAVQRWCRLTGREAIRDGDGVVFPVDVTLDDNDADAA